MSTTAARWKAAALLAIIAAIAFVSLLADVWWPLLLTTSPGIGLYFVGWRRWKSWHWMFDAAKKT